MSSAKMDKKKYRAAVEKYRQRMIDHPTKAELLIKSLLDQSNIPYEFQRIFIGRLFRITKLSVVDFYFPSINTILEIDGGYHNEFKQHSEDYLRTVRLMGTNRIKHILRFTNKEVFSNPQAIINKVNELLELARIKKQQQQLLRSSVKQAHMYRSINKRFESRPKRYYPRANVYSSKQFSQDELKALIPAR